MKNKALFFSTFLLLFLFMGNIIFGTTDYSLSEIYNALLKSPHQTSEIGIILLEYRLPQAITALLAGAALAVGGLIMQTLFANPLADPSILGVNSGAGLGVAIVLLFLGGNVAIASLSFSGTLLIYSSAFAGASLVLLLLIVCSSLLRSNLMLLITGIMFSYAIGAIISLLNIAATDEGVHSYIIWGMGNFSSLSLSRLPFFAFIILTTLLVTFSKSKILNALLLGETYATNLGINVQKNRTQLLILVGILSAITTACCGPITFFGLAVPHMVRLFIKTSDHRFLIPMTLLAGSCLALTCNLISNIFSTWGLLPINVLTPLFGVPVVLHILMKK